jgi:hypothetical protein
MSPVRLQLITSKWQSNPRDFPDILYSYWREDSLVGQSATTTASRSISRRLNAAVHDLLPFWWWNGFRLSVKYRWRAWFAIHFSVKKQKEKEMQYNNISWLNYLRCDQSSRRSVPIIRPAQSVQADRRPCLFIWSFLYVTNNTILAWLHVFENRLFQTLDYF